MKQLILLLALMTPIQLPALAASEEGVTARQQQSQQGSPIRFNRLMPSVEARNPPPALDGIHDPSVDGVLMLQSPKALFEHLPKLGSGNRVNWSKAVELGVISPRFDISNDRKKPRVMRTRVVREVKGFMPDVIFPHEQHTRWLDCGNCHKRLFKAKNGANPMSMASLMMGENCGACHGSVAFEISECRMCHSKGQSMLKASTAKGVTP
ncbi:cytochrome c, class I [Ferrimonas sediminicola]|uniref:Cytochrome c, class I n=1 Tax=Ferrimonas sediminicola TaxID=2569538 RepID=A0A4U1BDE1_9GAMM|nr:c(7)-type cytochrome triheme domain-containing protein [Ferrimonas sediminicola]TKB48288.1 cytochrome c, class I [Ferrimonas sediminicola]